MFPVPTGCPLWAFPTLTAVNSAPFPQAVEEAVEGEGSPSGGPPSEAELANRYATYQLYVADELRPPPATVTTNVCRPAPSPKNVDREPHDCAGPASSEQLTVATSPVVVQAKLAVVADDDTSGTVRNVTVGPGAACCCT